MLNSSLINRQLHKGSISRPYFVFGPSSRPISRIDPVN
jgi:hypothetical protein